MWIHKVHMGFLTNSDDLVMCPQNLTVCDVMTQVATTTRTVSHDSDSIVCFGEIMIARNMDGCCLRKQGEFQRYDGEEINKPQIIPTLW